MEPRPSTADLVAMSAAADSQSKADMTDWADELRVQRDHSSDPIVDPWPESDQAESNTSESTGND